MLWLGTGTCMCLIYLKFLLTSHQTLGNFGLIKNRWKQRLTNPSDRGLHDGIGSELIQSKIETSN